MWTQAEVTAKLLTLGVSRWYAHHETGRIRWVDIREEDVAVGRILSILRIEPSAGRYTMAYAVPEAERTYPVAPQSDVGPAKGRATKERLWERARSIGETLGADFVYQCEDQLVAVFDFTPLREPRGRRTRPRLP